MTLFKIRPFHGFDCDSKHGLNAGTYLDYIEVESDNENEAIELARSIFIKTHGIDTSSIELNETGIINHILGYFNSQGAELTKDDYMVQAEDSGSYFVYEYVDFNEVKRAK